MSAARRSRTRHPFRGVRDAWIPAAAAILGLAAVPAPARAQGDGAPVPVDVTVNSEGERYLRLLQVAGKATLHPWSVRDFGPREVARLVPADSLHPWAGRAPLSTRVGRVGAVLLRPQLRVFANSAFPYGENDGAVWAGRGLTAAVDGGFAMRYGALSLVLAPTLFVAQNASFRMREVAPDSTVAGRQFADPDFPNTIDLPQRFGDGAYTRLEPGQSTLRLDVSGFAAGISTANQHWGPAIDHPLVLGNNAAGFPHLWVGTSRPVPVGIGRLHGRVLGGQLSQSSYASPQGRLARRAMAGAAVVFTPRGLDGLEVGASRFYHFPGERLRIGTILTPFESLLKVNFPEDSTGASTDGRIDNQIASVFARLTLPRAGLEVYGEYAREDHSYDLRDLTLEPDHDRAYTLGGRKVWTNGAGVITSLRAEVMNAQISALDLVRPQTKFYVHFGARQGHTERGQALGSPSAYGGAGSVLALERYHPRGRLAVSWRRSLRAEETSYDEVDEAYDVQHALGAEAVVFSRGVELLVGTTAVYGLNRDFRGDAFNLNAVLGLRAAVR